MSQLVDDCVFAFDWQSDANQSVVGRRDDDRPERRVVSFTTSHRAIVAIGSTDGSPAAALRAVEHPRVRAQSSALRRSGSTAPGSHLTSAAPPVLRAWAPPTDTGGKGRETGAIRPTPALRAPRPNCLARDVAVVVDWPATCASWLKPANRLTPPGRRRVGHRRPSTRLVTDEPTTGASTPWDPSRTVAFSGLHDPLNRLSFAGQLEGLSGAHADGRPGASTAEYPRLAHTTETQARHARRQG